MESVHIPQLSLEEHQHSEQLIQFICNKINNHQGKISFSKFMELVLYSPNLGYYSNPTRKIGSEGDFITAPTISPLFAQTIAIQLAELLPQTASNIYEFGAGTGILAAELLNSLKNNINHYYIIEISKELSNRQQQYIQKHAVNHAHRVTWLEQLPEEFDGILIGNEVLDAMPVERIRKHQNGSFERAYIGYKHKGFYLDYQEINDNHLLELANLYYPPTLLEETYTSELHPTQHAFIKTLAQKLKRGAMIWIDYGFDAKQYYHPQRNDGTLIGHHRHHTIHDIFYRIGFTDLTTHINFTDIAQAGCDEHLDLIGYTNQATFLFNLGLLDLLEKQYPNPQTPEYFQAAHAIQQLTNPHEMGELFKVIAFGKDIDVNWQGFQQGDLCHKL